MNNGQWYVFAGLGCLLACIGVTFVMWAAAGFPGLGL